METDCRLLDSFGWMPDYAAGWRIADDWKVDGLLDQTVQIAHDCMEQSADNWMLESLNRVDLKIAAGSVLRIAIDLERADVRVKVGQHAKSAAVDRAESLANWESYAGSGQSLADVEQSSAGCDESTAGCEQSWVDVGQNSAGREENLAGRQQHLAAYEASSAAGREVQQVGL